MKEITVKEITLIKHPGRKVKVTLSTGSTVIIEPCHESWEQYGGTREELYVTMPIAEKYNAFLHGEEDS